jgi:hypothetical protein
VASEAFVEVVADTDGVEGQIVRDMTRAINAAERTIPEIDVEVNVDTDQVVRDANGRLRDARGRFVQAGEGLGQGLGDGLSRGAAPGITNVGSAASSASGSLGSMGISLLQVLLPVLPSPRSQPCSAP